MTEFTPEWIAKVRLSSHLIEPPAAEVIGECLDEISRLQSRVQELEAENIHLDGKKQTVFETLTNTIQRRDERIAELKNELMFYQMECPDLVGRYQPSEDGE